MIKSNRDLKDIIDFNKVKPQAAEGFVSIELKDPLTGKVKERIDGKNHVFEDCIFSYSGSTKWDDAISKAWFCLNDDGAPVDPKLPYLRGQTVGYGIPSQNGSGLYRGAYNVGGQSLAKYQFDRVSWKFQYDFTTAQALGTIRNAGLTYQYGMPLSTSYVYMPEKYYKTGAFPAFAQGATSDNRYGYTMSTAGIITKSDNWTGQTFTIDISGICGSTLTEYKTVGYGVDSGKYYVLYNASVAGNHKLFEFTDNNFTTVAKEHLVGWVFNNSSTYMLYIYKDTAYLFSNSDVYFQIENWETNNVPIIPSPDMSDKVIANNASTTEGNRQVTTGTNFLSMPFGDRYYAFGLVSAADNAHGGIYDFETKSMIATASVIDSNNSRSTTHPLTTYKYPSVLTSNGIGNRPAITTYILPTPVTKTDANSMTATYELEVYWE